MKPDGKFDVINETVRKHSVKFPIYKKGERPVSKLIEWSNDFLNLIWSYFLNIWISHKNIGYQ